MKDAILIIENTVLSDRNMYNCTATNQATGHKRYEAAEAGAYVRVKGNIDQIITNKKTFVNISNNEHFVSMHNQLIGKLAALWPFLGICAEVFILCAIILVYEKRRNKADLDESDTDQSPEQ